MVHGVCCVSEVVFVCRGPSGCGDVSGDGLARTGVLRCWDLVGLGMGGMARVTCAVIPSRRVVGDEMVCSIWRTNGDTYEEDSPPASVRSPLEKRSQERRLIRIPRTRYARLEIPRGHHPGIPRMSCAHCLGLRQLAFIHQTTTPIKTDFTSQLPRTEGRRVPRGSIPTKLLGRVVPMPYPSQLNDLPPPRHTLEADTTALPKTALRTGGLRLRLQLR